MTILWALFFLLFPALVLYLCRRFALLNQIGAIVICYAVGLILGNLRLLPFGPLLGHLGLLPQAVPGVQNAFINYTVPIALPLLFFSLNAKAWFKLAGVSLFAFLLEAIAVLVAATASFFVLRRIIGPETWKAVGMLIGCYTGGTINLAAIGTALRVDKNLFVAVNVSDMVISAVYLLLAITVLQRILLLVLPPFKSRNGAAADAEAQDFTSYDGILDRRRLPGLAAALGLAVLVFAVGGGASLLFPQEFSTVAAILIISTLGIALSFIPAVRRIEKSFQLGNYFILIFSLAVSSLADIGKLLSTAPGALALVGAMIFLCVLVHVILAAVFRIDADTVITTSIAGILSPPFVPMVATALKNREMIMTGVITGIIGWVIGTYLGISYGYLLRAIF